MHSAGCSPQQPPTGARGRALVDVGQRDLLSCKQGPGVQCSSAKQVIMCVLCSRTKKLSENFREAPLPR